MKTKFKVTLYQETYTEIEVFADDEDAAKELVLSGEFNDDDIQDVTVKDSDVIDVEEV